MLVVLAVERPHRIESGVEMVVGYLDAARQRGIDVPLLDQLGRQQDVVRAARAGSADAEGGPGRVQRGRQVGGDRRGHHARDDGRRRARPVGPGEVSLDLDVRGHVTGAAARDHGDVAALEPRLGQGHERRLVSHQRRSSHEARLAPLGGQLAPVAAEELAARPGLDRGRVADERQAAPVAQRRLDPGEIISEMAEHADAGDHHGAGRIAHGHGLTRDRRRRFGLALESARCALRPGGSS